MEMESIYGDHLPELEAVKNRLLAEIDALRKTVKDKYGMDPVEHCLARIKSEESMREKCRRRGLPETTESALVKIHDAVGIRVVTSFISDVYLVRDYLDRKSVV